MFAWMSVSRHRNHIGILDEFGNEYHYGIAEYEALKQSALEHGWTVFCPFKRSGQAFPFTAQAIADKQATVLASAGQLVKLGHPVGVAWKSGKRRAGVIDPDSWGWSEFNVGSRFCSPIEFLLYVRQACNVVGCGDADTPGALGTTRLNRYWRETGLPRLWVLPRDCRHWFHEQPVRPRIFDVETNVVYPCLREADLRSAYATALAGPLPIGQPVYVTSQDTTQIAFQQGVSYGLWTVRADTDILYGPVCRTWDKKPGLHIFAGTYTVPLWNEEARALEDSGAVCTFQRGYLWPRLATPFSDLVAELRGYREQAETAERPILADMLKRIPNALVGRFNCTSQATIVPADEAEADDTIIDLGTDGGAYCPPTSRYLVAVHVTGTDDCVPEHWYQYIVMRIALTVWRRERRELELGNFVVSANIDSLRVIQPSFSFGSNEGIEPDPAWREFLIRDAHITASRHIIGEKLEPGGSWKQIVRQPGIKRE